MSLYQLDGKVRQFLGENYFIADSAAVIGDVVIGDNVSIWFGAVVRGDIANITISDDTNIQDNCVLHVDYDMPLLIKEGVTVGHAAVLHGCVIETNSLIGMSAVILTGAKIGEKLYYWRSFFNYSRKEIPRILWLSVLQQKSYAKFSLKKSKSIKAAAEHYIQQTKVYNEICSRF